MSSTINPVITDAGLAAAIAADGDGLSLQITHVALGAGSYTPTGLETALVNRRETVTISSGSVGVGGTFNLSVLFGENTGAAYEAKEIGFFAGNPASGGVLFAVHSSATSIVYRSTLDFLAQFALTLAAVPEGSVSVLIDPAAAILHALIQEHKEEANPHPGYTTSEQALTLAEDVLQDHLDATNPHTQYIATTDFNALKARLDARIGTLFYHAAATAPASALKCNGAAVSRATYAALFAVIGTTYGAGNGSTTFNLPELRGEFIRSLDDGRGVDSWRGIGTAQDSANRSHSHSASADTQGLHTHGVPDANQNAGFGANAFDSGGTAPIQDVSTTAAGAHSHNISVGLDGANESRPRNVAALACIWFA